MISGIHQSPVGPLTLMSNGKALTHCEFENPRYPFEKAPRGEDPIIAKARKQLDAYFAGKLKAFDLQRRLGFIQHCCFYHHRSP